MTDRAPSSGGASLSIDAHERFAQRLAKEVAGVLGAGIVLQEVAVEGEEPARLRAACVVDGQLRELVGTGPTILEASRDLIRAAAEVRLATAWSRVIGRP